MEDDYISFMSTDVFFGCIIGSPTINLILNVLPHITFEYFEKASIIL